MIPLGHFILRDTLLSKYFIGTGTGFAPLYCQILHALPRSESPIHFVFGVREQRDLFYLDTLAELRAGYPHFSYSLYLSRETTPDTLQGYVTDSLSGDIIAQYQEFYICGSPAMVKSAREILESFEVSKEQIFWEQF